MESNIEEKTVGMVVHPQLTLGDMAEERGLNPVVKHKVDEIALLIIIYRYNRNILRITIKKLIVFKIGVSGNIKAQGVVPTTLDKRLEDTLSRYPVKR